MAENTTSQNGGGPAYVPVEPTAEQAAAATKVEKKESAPAVVAWDGKLKLRKPVIANGESVLEIVFREPSGGDIERIGNPLTVGMYENNPKIHFESQTMTLMMAHLAGVPPSTIRGLHPKDWNNGAWMLANFFMPDL